MAANREPLVSDEWRGGAQAKKKDTRHWCKGRVGVKHVPARKESDLHWQRGDVDRTVYELVCLTCGKRLRRKDFPGLGGILDLPVYAERTEHRL